MISETRRKVLELFAEGRRKYKLMKFAEARQFFAQALEADPADGPSRRYLERCEHFIAEPPPEDWDGVFDMKTK